MPQTLQVLRQYALHLLFAPPAPSPGMTGESAAPAKNLFPFQQKPNTLDRDHIVVPAGWDSWNKIAVLREGFEAKVWGEAWERDLEQPEGEEEGAPPGEPGARVLYRALVPDQGFKVCTVLRNLVLVLTLSTRSHTHYPPSTAQLPSKRSSRRTTTRTPRSLTATRAAPRSAVANARVRSQNRPSRTWTASAATRDADSSVAFVSYRTSAIYRTCAMKSSTYASSERCRASDSSTRSTSSTEL